MTSVNEIDALAERFRLFADLECGESQLYRALANCVASDREMLKIAAGARHGPIPNLFLAAVHDQLLQGRDLDLAAYYQTIAGSAALPVADAPKAFRDYVMESRDALEPALRERRVQTNEVRRAGVLYLAQCWLRERYNLNAIDLVEVGTSAGLLLATDQHSYKFGPGLRGADSVAEFVIETELRGSCPVSDSDPPVIGERIGIDLSTLDMSDESDRRWLRALIWGDQPERLARLEQAIEAAQQTPMRLIDGDANAVLPEILESLPPDRPAVVFHSHALNQFSPDAREQFDRVLREASSARAIYRIAMEGWSVHPVCAASIYRDGQMLESTDLALYDAHGTWIDWLAG